MFWNNKRLIAAILSVLFALLLGGCASVENPQNQVATEYLLRQAGFAKLEVTNLTPKREALRDAIPKGQFTDYMVNGQKYYVFNDASSPALYFGDEAAYQKFTSMESDKRVCQSMDAISSEPFWSCFQEFQKPGQP